jgi:hypothetical protein
VARLFFAGAIMLAGGMALAGPMRVEFAAWGPAKLALLKQSNKRQKRLRMRDPCFGRRAVAKDYPCSVKARIACNVSQARAPSTAVSMIIESQLARHL